MGKGGGIDIPGATDQEKALIDQQIAIQQLVFDQLTKGAGNFDALSPFLFEAAGLKPIFEMKDVFDPAREKTIADIANLKAIPEFVGGGAGKGPTTNEGGKPGGGAGGAGTSAGGQVKNPAFATAQDQIKALEAKLAAFKPTGQEATKTITGFEKIVDPLEKGRKDIEKKLQDRTLAGLEGKLPVDPALLEGLRTSREDLMSGLMKQLGSGAETSTPGIQALAEFEKNKGLILDAARRGDITLGENLGTQRSGINDALLGSVLGRQTGAAGAPFGVAGVAGGGGGNPLAFLQNQRQQQLQAAQANQQNSAAGASGFGSLLGIGLGFGLDKLFP